MFSLTQQRRFLPVSTVGLLALSILALAGCSGGGGGSAPASGADPSLATIPAYQAQRANTVTAAAAAEPDESTKAALVATNYHLAASHLDAQLHGGSGTLFGVSSPTNPTVVPPLTYATLRALGAAASGTSLTEISSHFDLAPTPYAAAQQTGMVASQSWAERGYPFRVEYLAATDAVGAIPRLASWSAAETGFTDGSASSDVVLQQALKAAGASLNVFDKPADIRLLTVHTLNAQGSWGAVTPVDGIFESAAGSQVRLPLLRLTENVTRHVGSDFSAEMLPAGALRVMTLRPNAGTLASFSSSRLEAALNEAVHALTAPGATPAAGEMLLPQAEISLSLSVQEPLWRAGVRQVYDEVQANLRALDGKGGTYVQQPSSAQSARLSIGTNGLGFRAASALAYTYSPINAHGAADGSWYPSSVTGTLVNFCSGRLVWPTPDLRPFFLAVLDAQGWVVELAAIQSLPGTAVEPTCAY